jgi:hypothetical protein
MSVHRAYQVQGKVAVALPNAAAGTIIIPARSGRSIIVTDGWLRAIGNTVTNATTIDVESTNGTPVSVTKGTAANLTVAAGAVRIGATGMSVEAGFNAALGVDDAVRLITVGTDEATATHIEYMLEFVYE